MKISELITELEKAKEKVGDVDVRASYDDFEEKELFYTQIIVLPKKGNKKEYTYVLIE